MRNFLLLGCAPARQCLFVATYQICRMLHETCIIITVHPCVCLHRPDRLYCKFIKRQWELLTVKGSSAEEHAKLFADAEGHSEPYELPLKPWIKALAGQQSVFRGRAPGSAPHLLAELLFVSEVMHVLQPPALQGDGVLFSADQLELLELLEAQHPSGPWGELRKAQVQVGQRSLRCDRIMGWYGVQTRIGISTLYSFLSRCTHAPLISRLCKVVTTAPHFAVGKGW